MLNEEARKIATASINTWAKKAIELQQELNYAEGIAQRAQKDYEKNQNEESRKNAISSWGKAWKIAKKLVDTKENIRFESSMLAQIGNFLYEQIDKNDIEKAYLFKSNSDYYATMSQRNATERDKMLEIKQKCMNNIKQLRRTAPTTEATA